MGEGGGHSALDRSTVHGRDCLDGPCNQLLHDLVGTAVNLLHTPVDERPGDRVPKIGGRMAL
jgi:hypothetical protein